MKVRESTVDSKGSLYCARISELFAYWKKECSEREEVKEMYTANED